MLNSKCNFHTHRKLSYVSNRFSYHNGRQKQTNKQTKKKDDKLFFIRTEYIEVFQ